MLVSVILTTYNRKELVTKTITSILSQSFQDFELIIVDNFSNYNFFELIKSFNSEKIKAFQNKNEGIIAVNRNFAIARSSGKYLAFCDDDDLWEPEKLYYQILHLENENVDLIYTNTKLMMENGNLGFSNYSSVSSLRCLLYKNQVTFSSVVVRKSTKVRFNESVDLIGLEDYELWINLNLIGFKFKFIELPLVKYRVHASISRQSKYLNERKKLKFLISLLKNKKIPFFLKDILFIKFWYLLFRLNIFYFIKA